MNQERTMYAIFLPGDDERWFNVSFDRASRAGWFAEMEGLNPGEYEIRDRNDVKDSQEEAA